MASTYVAGVFLTISTYNGPQFVYHCYDESVLNEFKLDEDSEDASDGEVEWSDDSISSADDDELVQPSASGSSRFAMAGSHKSESQMSSAGTGSLVSNRGRGENLSVPRLPGSENHSAVASPRLAASEGQKRGDEGTEPIGEFKLSHHGTNTGSNPSSKPHGNGSSSASAHEPIVNTIFGFDREFLAEMLSPPQSMCNERFSLAIDDCILVGIPIHILESGTWRPLKNNRGAGSSSSAIPTGQGEEETPGEEKKDSQEGAGTHTHSRSSSQEMKRSRANSRSSGLLDVEAFPELPRIPENGDKKGSMTGVVTEKDSPMRMFHVAFALIPPITEASICEEQVYRYILVPFVRMLRNEQASRNYVWQQVVKMQKAREETHGLSLSRQQQAVEEASELARALKNLFRAMTNMDIARIMVNNKARAFQVPLQLELSQLPSRFDRVSPHAYLGTSNLTNKEIKHDSLGSYGLLLLDEPSVIVQEIEVDPQGPVAAMIRSIDPTSSVEQLAQQNKIDINQIVSLVWSLVYWRRARIIIPLSHRHTYGVSPLAPIGSEFKELSRKFRVLFPMMPPLQRLLSNLSTGKPKPYMLQMPSADHRGIYMRALAWLLQNDFAIHLPTFALIVVTRKIKLASLNIDEANEDSSESAIDTEETRLSGVRGFGGRRSSSHRIEIEDIQDSIIVDPRNATSKEKRWLAQVAVSGATRNGELAALFERLIKYFNGLDCLEQIMIHENVNRVNMRRLLQEFGQYIVTFRHW